MEMVWGLMKMMDGWMDEEMMMEMRRRRKGFWRKSLVEVAIAWFLWIHLFFYVLSTSQLELVFFF